MRSAILLALAVGCGPQYVKLDIQRARKLDVPLVEWHDRPLSITANVPGRPEIADRIVLVPAFDCDAFSRHDGRAGVPRARVRRRSGCLRRTASVESLFRDEAAQGWAIARER